MTFVILFIIIAIAAIRIYLRFNKGKVGEHQVACILGQLPKEEYKVLNDLLIKRGNATTQIDHVVISEYGIFVIETKYYTGRIYGGENSEFWTQNIYGHKYRLRNPVIQNQGHIRALHSVLAGFGDIPFISIVAFSRKASLRVSTTSTVIYCHQIKRYIKQFTERKIPPIAVSAIYNKLASANLSEYAEYKKEHIRNIKTYNARRNRNVASGICPRCGGKLVPRRGKFGKFYGCSNYPRCKYTVG